MKQNPVYGGRRKGQYLGYGAPVARLRGLSMLNILIIIAIVMLAAVLAMLVAVMGKVGRLNAANTDATVRDEMQRVRQEMETHSRGLRKEVAEQQERANNTLVGTMHKLGEEQRGVLKDITTQNIEALDRMRIAVENKFAQIQESNEKKLDEMRRTVDEKLQTTLEKRLGESFKLVSERLEAVQRGLGEMQTLASDVGGLKRVLTNVKDRGTWGEYQLGAILSEILTLDQYAQNVSPKNNSDRVEYAVRLPGRAEDGGDPVWLPIDAKFPKEDYERLLDAVQAADMDGVKKCGDALARAVRTSAKDIHDKYINPPLSTDFGIMFLPSEGLYSEILRQPGLVGEIQNSYRVIVAGPTTLSSILSSLRVGFQTLAIEKRSHEVWKVLAAVKTEFETFGDFLEKVQKQINAASKTLESAGTRTKKMKSKLSSVQSLSVAEAATILSLPEKGDAMPDDDYEAEAGNAEGELV